MANGLLSYVIPGSVGGILLAIPLTIISYQLSIYVYNVVFHPLREFPGPISAAASNLPAVRALLKGDGVFRVVDLHKKYGEVVRVSPHELSFSGNAAYKDIYGHKRAGLPTLDKDPKFYGNPNGEYDIVNGNFEQHARMRRVFINAFSDQALKRQEPMFQLYVDKLVKAFRKGLALDPDKKFNMVHMWNFTTFDIMGDLTFGESLDMLENTDYHPWVAAMLPAFRYSVYIHAIRYFPLLEAFLIKYCIPQSTLDTVALHKKFCEERVDRRLARKDPRPDIWGMVLEKEGEGKIGLTKQEMYSNANLFMIAGTETTATLLSGLTFYLLSNPSKYCKLVTSLRSSISSPSDITIERLQSLKYLNACLEEGLRMYPSISIGLARKTPPGQLPTEIDGQSVPPDTRVFVTNLAAHRNERNYRDPYEFVPERWLKREDLENGDEEGMELVERYKDDKKQGFTPFSTGPRGCLGKNMAYHESRLILTSILFHFDLELCEESKKWNEHKIFVLWDKPALYCRVKPVERET